MLTHQVLLYYHYVKIDDPQTVREEHLSYCKELGLLGRIFISHEGINGTVSGTINQTNTYMNMIQNHPYFKGIDFKIDETEE